MRAVDVSVCGDTARIPMPAEGSQWLLFCTRPENHFGEHRTGGARTLQDGRELEMNFAWPKPAGKVVE